MTFDFDIQRFTDEAETGEQAEVSTEQTDEPKPIPEELSGLPEDIARETMAAWEQSQAEQTEQGDIQPQQPTQQPAPLSQSDYQAKLAQYEKLKAELSAYQPQLQQQPQQQSQPAPAPQVPPQAQMPQLKITPEISKKISEAISAEAKAMTGFSDDDVASLDYADDDDPRLAQWAQAKNIAQSRVYTAIYQTQVAQQQEAQRFFNEHAAAVNLYNEFARKEFAEPDFQAIQKYATGEFFDGLSPLEQKTIADSYIRVERQLASPAEMLTVKNYYERAKAAYRARSGKVRHAQPNRRNAPQLPRSDQLKGSSTMNDGQLSTSDIERLLEGDFTKIPPNQQKILLGLS